MSKQELNNSQKKTHVLQLNTTSTQSVGSGNTDIVFNNTQVSVGNSFTKSGNTIVVGAGVSVVKVSYNLMTDTAGSASYLFTNLYINGSPASQAIDATGGTGAFKSTSESKFFNVSQGDVIKLMASAGTGSFVTRPNEASYFAVERIA